MHSYVLPPRPPSPLVPTPQSFGPFIPPSPDDGSYWARAPRPPPFIPPPPDEPFTWTSRPQFGDLPTYFSPSPQRLPFIPPLLSHEMNDEHGPTPVHDISESDHDLRMDMLPAHFDAPLMVPPPTGSGDSASASTVHNLSRDEVEGRYSGSQAPASLSPLLLPLESSFGPPVASSGVLANLG